MLLPGIRRTEEMLAMRRTGLMSMTSRYGAKAAPTKPETPHAGQDSARAGEDRGEERSGGGEQFYPDPFAENGRDLGVGTSEYSL